tara:strand:+ start:1189 stop:1848 length:660 start_codon:yes stop_codon:yes gene_type:complete
MISYVITIMDNPKSVEVAKRCIASTTDVTINHFKAITPKDDLEKILKDNNIKNLDNFKSDTRYSRYDRCLSAFLSHLHCWKKCIENNETTLIFEHDAVMFGNLPNNLNFNKVITLAKPSYGSYNHPTMFGLNPLTQKRYFGGAHGYMIKPAGARELLEKSKTDAGPTDVFLNLDNFPWLQEYYPWIIEVKDTFTTIQNNRGCRAKDLSHMKEPRAYEII